MMTRSHLKGTLDTFGKQLLNRLIPLSNWYVVGNHCLSEANRQIKYVLILVLWYLINIKHALIQVYFEKKSTYFLRPFQHLF